MPRTREYVYEGMGRCQKLFVTHKLNLQTFVNVMINRRGPCAISKTIKKISGMNVGGNHAKVRVLHHLILKTIREKEISNDVAA